MLFGKFYRLNNNICVHSGTVYKEMITNGSTPSILM